MKEDETLYARWFNNELTDEELEALTKEGVIDDLKRIVQTTDRWNVTKYNKLEGLKKFKSKQNPKRNTTQQNSAKVNSAEQNSTQQKGRRINLKWIAGIAASLLLLLTVFNYYDSGVNEVVLADNGNNKSVDLPDGSLITVNDGSSVSYSREEFSNKRNIELTGEALFKVEKGYPFIVNTKNGSVEVLGTEFNVRAWGDNLYVECYEGSVRVSDGMSQTILSPSEAVNFVAGSMNEKQKITHLSPLWSVGTSRFYDENINEVFLELERQYDVKVKMPQMNQTFSGIFNHSNLDETLQSICVPLGLKYKLSEDQKEVLIE